MPPYSLDTLDQFIGEELGVSDWLTVDQTRINAFADCTGDHQWIHVDVERAERESPFGTTIAHGYLTLSLLPTLRTAVSVIPEGVSHAINYGLDKVRFLSPVQAGARIRNRVQILSADKKRGGRILLKTKNTVEVEGTSTPAMIAESLVLLIGREGE